MKKPKFGKHSRDWRPPKHQPPDKITYVSIKEAYETLSLRAFSLWIRLHLEDEDYYGRWRMYEEIAFCSRTTGDRCVNELRLNDYMIIQHPQLNKKTRFKIVKRALIPRKNLFAVLDPELLKKLKNAKSD